MLNRRTISFSTHETLGMRKYLPQCGMGSHVLAKVTLPIAVSGHWRKALHLEFMFLVGQGSQNELINKSIP